MLGIRVRRPESEPVAPWVRYFRNVTKTVTKPKPKKRRCAWCRNDFRPSGRGRPPRFCSNSCRQRAYEKRREQQQATTIYGALRALRRDLGQSQVDAHIREIVVQVLEDHEFLQKRPRAGKLQLLKKPSRTKKEP